MKRELFIWKGIHDYFIKCCHNLVFSWCVYDENKNIYYDDGDDDDNDYCNLRMKFEPYIC